MAMRPPRWLSGKKYTCQFRCVFDPWVGKIKGMTTHSSILAWEILWAEKPGRGAWQGLKESDTT